MLERKIKNKFTVSRDQAKYFVAQGCQQLPKFFKSDLVVFFRDIMIRVSSSVWLCLGTVISKFVCVFHRTWLRIIFAVSVSRNLLHF